MMQDEENLAATTVSCHKNPSSERSEPTSKHQRMWVCEEPVLSPAEDVDVPFFQLSLRSWNHAVSPKRLSTGSDTSEMPSEPDRPLDDIEQIAEQLVAASSDCDMVDNP
jgi:hypothetical protein